MTLENIPLTIIILTHRADERFRQSLASAQPAAEILIGDYQSENNWQKLKKDFKFKKIGRSVPINNFAAERNHFLKQAKHDWVLFLDSDEVITENSWPTISKIVKQNKIKGVFVRRQDVFYGKKLKFGETGNNWLLRLMRKDQAKFIRPVHEVVETTGLTKKSAIVLEHFAHQNVNEFFRDISRYAMIQAEYQQDHQLPDLILALKTVAYPKLKFFHNYFLKLGFLDGWRGLVYATMMSLHSVIVRVFSYENR